MFKKWINILDKNAHYTSRTAAPMRLNPSALSTIWMYGAHITSNTYRATDLTVSAASTTMKSLFMSFFSPLFGRQQTTWVHRTRILLPARMDTALCALCMRIYGFLGIHRASLNDTPSTQSKSKKRHTHAHHHHHHNGKQ